MKGEKFQAQHRSWSVQYLYLYESRGIIFMFDERKVKDFRGKKIFFFLLHSFSMFTFYRNSLVFVSTPFDP